MKISNNKLVYSTLTIAVRLILSYLYSYQTTTYDFPMIQGYKVTTYTILAHKGLQKTFQITRQEKDTVSEETSSGHIWWRLDQLRGCPQAEFQTE